MQYHPETLAAYCANPYECMEDHPNSLVNVAKRGEIFELLSYKEAANELERRIEKYLEKHDQPFIAKFLRENTGKAMGTKMDSKLMTRFARYMEVNNLDSISDAMRALIDTALTAFERKHNLDPNFMAQELPDDIPPAEAFEPVAKREPVSVPVKRVEPTVVNPDDDEWTF